MPSALYTLATGQISATSNASLTDQNQIAALKAQGIGVLEVPLGVTGGNAIVDLATNTVLMLTSPPAIPNIFVQYVAAQINNGAVSASAFHPNTIAEINSVLTSVNLTAVSNAAPISAAVPAG